MINPDGNYVADDISDEYAEATPSEWPLTHWMPLPKEPKPQSRRGRSSERVGKLFEFRRKEKTMSNAKWKIVPAVVTDERAATAVMVAHEAGYPMIAVSVAREVIKADIAAAPEPDWEELAEQIYAYYWNDYDTNGSASLVRALKITLGSVK